MQRHLDVERQLSLGSRPAVTGRELPAGQQGIPYMTGAQVRDTFLRFFEAKGHTVLPSYPLVPQDDPSILWINCGMAPLKPYFQGVAQPPNVRLATAQKSIRLNDIENVGLTPRHHTFFEMLGNFSIGDYFKAETIAWAWELVIDHFRLPPELIHVTVHPSDDESRQIWLRDIGLPADRIYDDPSNFWDIGPGPCGPNTELYIDRGHHFGCGAPDCGPLCECGRFLEFYNLVFPQYNHNEDGSRSPLPRRNVDTGMGLERMTSIMQGVASNFETDLLWPLVDGAAALIGTPYGQEPTLDLAMRIIADHVRSVVFASADGPQPGNEGRGYVIRRLLRRAARYGLAAGLSGSFLYRLVPVATRLMAGSYPEVSIQTAHLTSVVLQEEERFAAALRDGTRLAAELVAGARAAGQLALAGEAAFLLYDTFGFPLDLTEDLAREAGLGVDRAGFDREMDEQRRRARAARSADAGWESDAAAVAEALAGIAPTEFVGYDQLSASATVKGLVVDGIRAAELDGAAGEAYVCLDRTPFYAESGGQVADEGQLIIAGGVLQVIDVQRLTDGRIVHRVASASPVALCEGQIVEAAVDVGRRLAVARNHTATHLLHRALKEVLGDSVNQAGSLVTPDRLRFDFSYGEPLSAGQLLEVEQQVNEAILRDLPVSWCDMSIGAARAAGAVALFGEKYGDIVRVVTAGEWSQELCGGTHVQSTGQIGLCFIPGEGSIGSGLRRIEAHTGHAARGVLRRDRQRLEEAAGLLRAAPADVTARTDELLGRLRELERENESLRVKLARGGLESIVARKWEFAPGLWAAAGQVTAASADELRQHSDVVRERLGAAGIGVLAAKLGDKAGFVVTVGADLVACGIGAGDVAKEISAVAGGSGGGRRDMAQAGGRDPEKIDAALAVLPDLLPKLLAKGRKA